MIDDPRRLRIECVVHRGRSHSVRSPHAYGLAAHLQQVGRRCAPQVELLCYPNSLKISSSRVSSLSKYVFKTRLMLDRSGLSPSMLGVERVASLKCDSGPSASPGA